jgi:hypoxanthine phosphoribosyltransferase
MAEAQLRVLLNETEIASRVDDLAARFAVEMDESWTLVALLQGAMPFAVDLMRALAVRGKHPILDSLWLESYRDARESSGKVVVRADISRAIEGRTVLIVDDVFDSGRTIAFARAHLNAKGAARTVACAFVRKPQALGEPIDAVPKAADRAAGD